MKLQVTHTVHNIYNNRLFFFLHFIHRLVCVTFPSLGNWQGSFLLARPHSCEGDWAPLTWPPLVSSMFLVIGFDIPPHFPNLQNVSFLTAISVHLLLWLAVRQHFWFTPGLHNVAHLVPTSTTTASNLHSASAFGRWKQRATGEANWIDKWDGEWWMAPMWIMRKALPLGLIVWMQWTGKEVLLTLNLSGTHGDL